MQVFLLLSVSGKKNIVVFLFLQLVNGKEKSAERSRVLLIVLCSSRKQRVDELSHPENNN